MALTGRLRSQVSMQYSIHPPSSFICLNRHRLLPEWSQPVRSVLIVLQPASVDLSQQTAETEAQKEHLRRQFLKFAYQLTPHFWQQGHFADWFDPKTGWPCCSQAGSLSLDDVAVVRSLLGYATTQFGACSTLLHPDWGSAVYPSVLVSSADPGAAAPIVDRCHQSRL